MPDQSPPTSWLHRLRVNVRTQMVFVLVLGGCLGWFAHLSRQARIQRDAVATITRLGGSVLYDWQFEGNRFRLKPGTTTISNDVPGWPRWLVDRLGVDAFGSVSQVSFRRLPRKPSPAESEEVLAQIGHLSRLKRLTFINVPVTDTGLAHLKELTNLELFMLRGSDRVTDAGVAHLASLTGLKELYLEDSRISDAGLAYLSEMSGLETLNLARTQIGDAGLAHLERLTRLENLGLDGTKVTDAGLARLLRGRSILKSLYLDDTQIGDVGLEPLEGMTRLAWLSLRNTHVSDAGLVHLRGLTKLQSVDLSDTRVSDAGLEELRTALPDLRIKRSVQQDPRPPQP